jgi:transposase
VRERAVALVLEHQSDYGSQWEAIVSIAAKVGVSAEVGYNKCGWRADSCVAAGES